MKRVLFAFLIAAGLTACGADSSPAMGPTSGDSTMGTTTEDTDTDEGTGTDGTDDGTDGTDGGTDTGTLDMGTEDPVAPGPDEPCDPLDSEYPCDGGDLDYSCSPVIGDKGPAPDFQNIWEFRCVRVQDIDLDGADPGDFCGANEWKYEGTWRTGCMNTYCVPKYEDQGAGPQMLPESLCGGAQDPDLPQITQCCVPFCEVDADCGNSDAKCRTVTLGAPGELLEFGYCVDKEYQP